GVACDRQLVGLTRVLADRATAGLVVLDDRARRLCEGLHELARRAEGKQVVEGELLAVQLRDAVEEMSRRSHTAVEGRLLVRILAVAQVCDLLVGVRP